MDSTIEDSLLSIITQNVDDLHERAGSTNVIHLHGELLKVRSTRNPLDIKEWKTDLVLGDKCEKGYQLRPHIVWFGEDVPMIEKAVVFVKLQIFWSLLELLCKYIQQQA